MKTETLITDPRMTPKESHFHSHRNVTYRTFRTDGGACLWWAKVSGQILGGNSREGVMQMAQLHIDDVLDVIF